MRFLAQAYRNADESSDAELDKMQQLLHIMAAHPDFQAYKEVSYDVLDLKPDGQVADLACGLGFDLPHLKDRVPEGYVTGFDLSAKFLAAAQARIETSLGGSDPSIQFRQSDARNIDSDTGWFDAVRIDRSLQHVADPEAALAEMLRILKPGGIVCAAEPDWGSFAIASSHPGILAKIASIYNHAIVNPLIGRALVDMIGAKAHLTHHSVHPLHLRTLSEAKDICTLEDTTDQCFDAGLITNQERDAFWQDLEARDASGRCFVVINIHLVAGRKSGPKPAANT